MRNAQLYNQIFVYILALVLVSAILIFGYNSIIGLRNRAEKISCIKMEDDLKNAVAEILSDYGSTKTKQFQLCQSYRQICFVETFRNPVLTAGTDPIIKDSIQSKTGKNAFLVDNIAKESFFIGNISVEPDVLCISSGNNNIRIRLEGKGTYAIISQA